METEVMTDKYGFPIQTCSRCGGSGHHQYNQVTGTRCFKCGGKGHVHTKKALPAFQQFAEAFRKSIEVSTRELIVGEKVAYDGKWHSINAITKTDRVSGSGQSGNEPVVYYYFYDIELSDGETTFTCSMSEGLLHRVNRERPNPETFLALIK